MEKIERIVRSIWLFGVLSSLTGMFLLLVVQIFSRFVLNTPLLGTDEVAMLFFIWMVFVGALGVVKDDEMIRLNVVYRVLPVHIRHYLSIVFNLVFISVCVAIIPASIRLLKGSWMYRFDITQIPWTFVYLAGVIFFSGSAVLCSIRAFQLLSSRSNDPPGSTNKGIME